MEKLFEYNPTLAKSGHGLVPEELASQTPIEALKTFTEKNSDLLAGGGQELFFYGLMAMRRFFPQLFLPPDLALLAANVARGLEKDRLALLDWELLPSAILLSMDGIKIALPDNEISMPIPTFNIIDGEASLGWDLEAHFNQNTDFQKTLGEAAIFLSPRDFLTSMKTAIFREKLIKDNLIEKILQLPKPKRQNFNIYPILMILGKTDSQPGFSKIDSCNPGPGGLDQKACLDALQDNTTLYTGQQTTGKIPLRKLANVFRCQFPRKKAADTENLPPDSIIAREIALGDANPITGLIEKTPQSFSLIDTTKLKSEEKCFLQKDDILMVFRGAEKTLGKTALYQTENETAIPNRAFCVIRAKREINPIWLFYALQRQEITDKIRENGSGKDTLIVSLDAIRDIEVTLPTPELDQEIAAKHENILEKTRQIQQLENEIKAKTAEIKKLI